MKYKTIVRNTKSGLDGELVEYVSAGAKVRVNGNMRVWRNYEVVRDELAEVAKNELADSVSEVLETSPVELSDEPVQDSEDRKRENEKIDDDVFFKYFYLPFIMYEVFWDYADTIHNMAAQMRLSECKKLGRTIKQLRQEFDWMRRKHLDDSHCEHVQNHMETFQDICGKELGNELKLIKWKVRHENLQFSNQQVEFYAFVFLTMALWRAVLKYSVLCDKEIEKTWGNCRNSIIPIQIAKMAKLIPEYLGDRRDDLNAEDIKSSAERIYKLIMEVNFVGEFQK